MATSLRLFALTTLTAGAFVVAAAGHPAALAAANRRLPRASTCGRDRCREAWAPRSTAPNLIGVLDRLSKEGAQPSIASTLPITLSKALSAKRLASLISACAPTTPASLVRSIVLTESGGYALRMATNGAPRRTFTPLDSDAARATLAMLIGRGANVDIGLMQLNSATLARMHVAANEALDPCRNLAIGAQIFDRAYAAAYARRTPTSPLWSASSIYNTGDPVRGLRNGYAGRIQARLRTSGQATG